MSRNSFSGTEQLYAIISFNICERPFLYFQFKSVLTLNEGVLYAQIRVVEMCLAYEWWCCVSAKKQLHLVCCTL